MSEKIDCQSLSHPIPQRFAERARRHDLFGPGDRVLVAVSGGPDSVALLSLLAEIERPWRLDLCALHMNHGLRGEESEQDEGFVMSLCQRLGIKLQVERLSPTSFKGPRKGHSLQERAREARYRTMQRVRQALGAKQVALGHTADDQAETVLMWMLRGSGARGLGGIPPAREGIFIRPLLEFRRSELTSFLEAKGIPFRTDSSNASTVYFRNRIRQELLPMLHRFNPAIVDVLCRQAEILREEDRYLDDVTLHSLKQCTVEQDTGAITLDHSGILSLPLTAQRRLVRNVVRRLSGATQGPSFQAVTDILEKVIQGPTGAALSVHGAYVTRSYNRLHFRAAHHDDAAPIHTTDVPLSSDQQAELSLPIPSTLSWPPTSQRIRVWMQNPDEVGRGGYRATQATTVMLDADRFTKDLKVRCWQDGDTFRPQGMGGHSKKLQDFFSDSKVPRHERHRIPLLVAPEGILWIVGYRSDHRFCATPASRNILAAEVERAQPSS